MPEAPQLATIRVTDINYFESITARLPTEEESTQHQIPRDVPVLVLRLSGGREQVYRSDQIRFTIDTAPPSDPDGTRAEVGRVLGLVIEAMENRMHDLQQLYDALSESPSRIRELAERLEKES